MKISVYESVGDYSKSVDVEFSSDVKSDCDQADKIMTQALSGNFKISVASAKLKDVIASYVKESPESLIRKIVRDENDEG